MSLNSWEVNKIRDYLRGTGPRVPRALAARVELGVWVFDSSQWAVRLIYGWKRPASKVVHPPFLLIGNFGSATTQEFFDGLREGKLPYLMVRAGSWEVFLNCNGEILSEHCEENLDAVRDACENLRKQCGADTPSVKA